LKNQHLIDKSLFESIRLYYSAGADIPATLNQSWQQSFGRFVRNGIGTTEIGHVFMTTTTDDEIYTTGKVVSGYTVKLCDENGTETNNGQGELWVKPPYHLLGYWENNDANHQKFQQGWYRTGDMFVVNDDSTYSYVGRADDLFKVNGRWIAPLEIENFVLSEFKDIEDVAVVGVKNEEREDIPAMFLVSKSEETELFERLKLKLSQKFERYKIPVKMIMLKELPKNENGKLLRRKLINL
jgi:acyl-coenzyme A synthetase/AMP-(fatty) acid ligase